jgi:alpha-N-arabinofuranosidase
MLLAHDGSWWTVFLGIRARGEYSPLGRETFLAPVGWTMEGWPVAGAGHHIESEMIGPSFFTRPQTATTLRETFSSKGLGLDWIYVRNPPRDRIRLDEREGYLRLYGTAAKPGDIAPLAWVGRRLAHHESVSRTLLEFTPSHDGEEAGLCLRASDEHLLQIAVKQEGGRRKVVCSASIGGKANIFASRDCLTGPVWLEITSDRETCRASYSLDGMSWVFLGSMYTNKLEHMFTGLALGVYATGNGRESRQPADFAWVEMHAHASVLQLEAR